MADDNAHNNPADDKSCSTAGQQRNDNARKRHRACGRYRHNGFIALHEIARQQLRECFPVFRGGGILSRDDVRAYEIVRLA